jgi:hypothetical protein
MKTDFVDLAKQGGSTGRGDCQWGWYDYVRDAIKGMTVLDVGTGLSRIKERLPECKVTTHEASEQCPADIHGDLGQVPTGKYQVVTCFDVVEHVVDYGALAWNMARIASRYVFLTTPGRSVTLNSSPFHFNEFHPWELLQLLEATGLRLHTAWAQKWEGPAQYEGSTPLNLITGVIPVTRKELLMEPFLHPIALFMAHP